MARGPSPGATGTWCSITSSPWRRRASGRIINVACSGKFSSDRTFAEYAAEIWGAKPILVP